MEKTPNNTPKRKYEEFYPKDIDPAQLFFEKVENVTEDDIKGFEQEISSPRLRETFAKYPPSKKIAFVAMKRLSPEKLRELSEKHKGKYNPIFHDFTAMEKTLHLFIGNKKNQTK